MNEFWRLFGLIGLTLVVAWLLSLFPLPADWPSWVAFLRPQWTTLLLIFWIIHFPKCIGVIWSFVVGVIVDVMLGVSLGHHALSFSIIGYMAVELEQRMQLFQLWQQTLSVGLLLTVERLLSLWILGASGQPTPTISYWLAPIVGMLVWPWLRLLLLALCRRVGLL